MVGSQIYRPLSALSGSGGVHYPQTYPHLRGAAAGEGRTFGAW